MSESVELPEEVRSDQVVNCPLCTFTGVRFMQHMAQAHPDARDGYEEKRLRVYVYEGGDGDE